VNTSLSEGLLRGLERVTAWSGVLDDINVFPVADGDTGSNLTASLAPLRRMQDPGTRVTRELLLSARGNSGNIAAGFVAALLEATESSSACRGPSPRAAGGPCAVGGCAGARYHAVGFRHPGRLLPQGGRFR
jgi:hypothetical protein